MIDFKEDADNVPQSEDNLTLLAKYASEMRSIEDKMAEIAIEVQKLSDRHDALQLQLIPDVMTACGLKNFTTADNFVIKVDDFLRGAVPTKTAIDKADDLERPVLEKRRSDCFAWLAKVHGESIIKGEVVVSIAKGEKPKAEKLVAELIKSGHSAKFEEEVNFQTLNAFLRERHKAGEEIPVEPFGLFVGKKATLKTK